jgi:hypothetical protein
MILRMENKFNQKFISAKYLFIVASIQRQNKKVKLKLSQITYKNHQTATFHIFTIISQRLRLKFYLIPKNSIYVDY